MIIFKLVHLSTQVLRRSLFMKGDKMIR